MKFSHPLPSREEALRISWRWPSGEAARHFATVLSHRLDEVQRTWPGVRWVRLRDVAADIPVPCIWERLVHLPFRILVPGTHMIRIPMERSGAVFGDDIYCPPEIRLMKSGIYLFTVQSPASVDGYALVSHEMTLPPEQANYAWFPLSRFTPRWLSWSFAFPEEAVVELEIATDGRLSARDVLQQAAQGFLFALDEVMRRL